MSSTPVMPDADTPNTATSRKLPLWQLALTGVGGLLLTTAGLWYVLTPEPPTPAERLVRALELLDSGRDHAAREIAETLEVENYHDVEFAGGVEYALGLCHFHEALRRTQADSQAAYAAAATYLREAERRGIPASRRPTYIYALAISLLQISDRVAALPLLEEASLPANPHHVSAGIELVSLYLDPTWRTSARLQAALKLNDLVLADVTTPEERLAAARQRVEILILQGQFAQATEKIKALQELEAPQKSLVILRARLLMGQQDYVAAVKLLEAVAAEDRLDRTLPRQASYLMGLASELRMQQLDRELLAGDRRPTAAAERAEYRQRAIEYYTRTTTRFDLTEESLAASLHLGQLQQEDGADEKAIQSFGSTLRRITRVEEFHNQWIGLDEYRQRILTAWNRWIDVERFPEAIALADLMTPAFPRDQAYELAARARQRWAEQAEQRWLKAGSMERQSEEAERNRLWRESAAAFAKLAQARRTAVNYPEAVWQAADHYYRGHDYVTALDYVNQFLEESSVAMRPVALVRRGRILLDLDRLQEAEASFQKVRKDHATSPAAFSAAFQLAVCRLEQNDLDGADAAWRSILTSGELSPGAVEWRDALLALSRLQIDRASWSRRQLERDELAAEKTKSLWNEVSTRSREASELLEQYVSRYPEADAIAEARYLLGKSLQLQGDYWRRIELTAETENARSLAGKETRERLQRSAEQFQRVRDSLAAAAEQDRLTPMQQTLYRNAWFEYPHSLFALGQYQEAVTAYAATIHQFPQDVRVLTAYVQMAEAYSQLHRPIEAQSMLEQARVILDQEQIPTTAFLAPTTSLTRVEWEQWLDRARHIHRD